LKIESLFRPSRVESDLNDELADYLAHERQRFIADGLSPEDAHRAALRVLGSPALVREDVRATWNWNWLDSVWKDIRYALRGFRRAPLFTTVAVVTLAFGIGANTAIFSLIDQVLLQMLPVKHPEQLVSMAMRGQQYGGSWGADKISPCFQLDTRHLMYKFWGSLVYIVMGSSFFA
jgi:hypothetical protein